MSLILSSEFIKVNQYICNINDNPQKYIAILCSQFTNVRSKYFTKVKSYIYVKTQTNHK